MLTRSIAIVALAIMHAGSAATVGVAEEPPAARKIVLLAGKQLSHPPGCHEYEKDLALLKHCLDTSPNVKGVRTELCLGGWPADAAALDDAATIVLVSDGTDRDEAAHPFMAGDRLAVIDKQMKRGCGLLVMHYSSFVPANKGGEQYLEWIGGYFDYQNGPGGRWYSAIKSAKTLVNPGAPEHPVCRGLRPFELQEEYYYNIRFRENDPRLVPIFVAAIPGEAKPQVVAWAVQRADGGRGVGFTGGHSPENLRLEDFRKMILNAILWTARVEVPPGGVDSTLPTPAAPPPPPPQS